MDIRRNKAIRLCLDGSQITGPFPAIPAAFWVKSRGQPIGVREPSKKNEHETSRRCLKSEYLTLLNTFRVLQDCLRRAYGLATDALLSCKPPKPFDEKELYGR